MVTTERERRRPSVKRNRSNESDGTKRSDARAPTTSRHGSDARGRDTTDRPTGPLFELQRRYGNQAVQRLVTDETQTKLSVGPPDDRYEREADRVAETVTRPSAAATPASVGGRSPSAGVQRMCPRCRRRASEGKPLDCPDCERAVQREEDVGSATPAAGSDATSAVGSLGSGRPLPDSVRSYFEPRFGTEFDDVRIHTGSFGDAAAAAMNARAFTTGRHVGFRAGEFSPETRDGRELIAHELTHVLQQRRTTTNAVQLQRRDPGDCTYAEHRALQKAVDAACKVPRGCNSQQSLEVIERNIVQNAACIAARRHINAKCYRGGDPKHKKELQLVIDTLIECQRIRELKRSKEKEPEVDPEALRRVGIAAGIGAGVGAVLGAIIGGVGGGVGGTLVAPGVGTVGGVVAGGTAGAVQGAAIGGIAGGLVGGGLQALVEWWSD